MLVKGGPEDHVDITMSSCRFQTASHKDMTVLTVTKGVFFWQDILYVETAPISKPRNVALNDNVFSQLMAALCFSVSIIEQINHITPQLYTLI